MRTLALASRMAKEIYRDPLSLILGLCLPLGLLGLYSFINGRVPESAAIFTPTVMTPAVAAFGFSFIIMFLATLLAKDRRSSLVARLLSTPLSPADFVAAYAAPFLPFALAQVAACYALGAILGAAVGPWSLEALLFLLPLALSSVGIGILVGSLCTENQVAGAGTILINLIGIGSGAFLDLSMVGGTAERILRALPYAQAIDGARALATGASLSSRLPGIAASWAYAVAFLGLGALAFSRTTRRR